MPVPSALFKAKAREVLRGRWQTALLIALAVNLPSLLVQGISAFSGTDLIARLESLVITISRDGMLTQQALVGGIQEIFSDSGVLISLGFTFLAWLITPCLSLGMIHWLLGRLRKNEGDEGFPTVFSRLNISHKAMGLLLTKALMIGLWMLPGMVLTGLSVLPLRNAGPTNAEILSAMNTSMILVYGGLAVMAVPGIMAALRLAMADILLSDHPEKGVFACVRESKAMMNRRKGQLFSLELSFIFWYLAEMLVSSLLAGMGSGILSLMVQMLAGLFLSVYIQAAVCAFYEAVRKLPSPSADTPTPGPEEEEALN